MQGNPSHIIFMTNRYFTIVKMLTVTVTSSQLTKQLLSSADQGQDDLVGENRSARGNFWLQLTESAKQGLGLIHTNLWGQHAGFCAYDSRGGTTSRCCQHTYKALCSQQADSVSAWLLMMLTKPCSSFRWWSCLLKPIVKMSSAHKSSWRGSSARSLHSL